MSYGLLSPLSYGTSGLSNPSSTGVRTVSRYAQTQLQVADAYKEQQYWLSVYNYAQQFGLKNTSIENIITQLQRVGQKLSALQSNTLPAIESWMNYENQLNQESRTMFQSS